MMNFAICDWVPNLTDETLEAWQRDGVTAMEPGPAFLLERNETALQRDAATLDARGIRIYSCHAPFGGRDDLSQADEDGRKLAIERHAIALRRASLAGASCLVIHPSGNVSREERDHRVSQLKKSLEPLIEKAEETGVRLALENMPPGLLCYRADLLRSVVDQFDSPFLGICFDSGHANIGGDANAAFLGLRERIITFHLHDNDGNGDRHLQPPYGTIDWESLAPHIVNMKFEHAMSIEAPPWSSASFGMQLREMRALFAGQLLRTTIGNRSACVVCSRCRRYCFGTPDNFFCGCSN